MDIKFEITPGLFGTVSRVDSKPERLIRSNKGKSLAKFVSNYTLIDIETSDLDPRWSDIYEVAGIKVRDNEIADQFTCLIKPEGFSEVPSFITQLTGITTEMILTDGKNESDTLKNFFNFVSDDIVVGHNVNFDINFLYDKGGENFCNDFIDTLRIARHAWPDEPHNRLKDLRKRIGKPQNDNPHRAFSDSLMTKIVFDTEKNILGNNWFYKKQYHAYSRKPKTKAKDIKPSDISQINVDSPLFRQNIVFTGKLESFTRTQAWQLVANFGGNPQQGINKATNYLVIGDTSFCPILKGGLSGKQKKAQEKLQEGQDIKIITESVFLDMLNEDKD
ncbi:exonuclease domain-containing protein [Oenococcus sicerae]|uniref:DNA polymerase III polC-type n=1 Tax=Oenococcus sicerae TaxID=2203724 RepID=A0AAJ1R872_9LACO|nr:exonuclease domain-containing protein [Oenococcus sicerae]MDN6899537.1 DNA polymerase III subunit epsilon [Oenococcus sicerae]